VKDPASAGAVPPPRHSSSGASPDPGGDGPPGGPGRAGRPGPPASAARRPRLIADSQDGRGRPSPEGDAGDEARDEQDRTLLALARRAAADHQDQHGQPITRDALRARLGVSNQAASELLRQLRAGHSPPPGAAPTA